MIAYLASPYSHADLGVMAQRHQHVCEAAALLFAQGHLTYSPIAHTVAIAAAGDLDGDFSAWATFDITMIDRLDEMWVLRLDGWEQSLGVAAEVNHAIATGKPVRYAGVSIEAGRVVDVVLE